MWSLLWTGGFDEWEHVEVYSFMWKRVFNHYTLSYLKNMRIHFFGLYVYLGHIELIVYNLDNFIDIEPNRVPKMYNELLIWYSKMYNA